MKKLSEDQLKPLLEAGYESRNLEYKPAFLWGEEKSIAIQERVIKGILAMTNTRAGGQIVLGVSELEDGTLELIGLSDAQLHSFENSDKVRGNIDKYAGSSTFDVVWGEHNGKKYVIFTIPEFDDQPIICKNNGQIQGNGKILVKDELYVRSKKSPYSSIKATEVEFREIIGMAVDKEKIKLETRGWFRKGLVRPEDIYSSQISDLVD